MTEEDNRGIQRTETQDLGRSRPATVGNLRSGAKLCRLVQGKLPKQFAGASKWGALYRRQLERACVESHGEIGIAQAHWLDAAVSAEIGCAILMWLMRSRYKPDAEKPGMTVEQVGNLVAHMTKLKQVRNSWVAKLDLDRDAGTSDPADFYAGIGDVLMASPLTAADEIDPPADRTTTDADEIDPPADPTATEAVDHAEPAVEEAIPDTAPVDDWATDLLGHANRETTKRYLGSTNRGSEAAERTVVQDWMTERPFRRCEVLRRQEATTRAQ
ncbi:MAG: hypothetical protein ACYC3X_06145 [Pirellulaceae bacterium]